MAKRFHCPKHQAFVRTKPCALCGSSPVEAHHLLKPWQGFRGTGLKAGDQNLMPLCPYHHRELHMRGDEMEYFNQEKGDRTFGKVTAMQLWFESPAYKEDTKNG